MKLEGYKAAWLSEKHGNSQAAAGSMQILRTSNLLDWEHSRGLSQIIFSFLFAFVTAFGALSVLPNGTGKPIAVLFAGALVIEGITASFLYTRRPRGGTENALREFLTRKHSDAARRNRLERISNICLVVLAAVALAIGILGPSPSESPARALDLVATMLLLTAFLAVTWWRARSFSRSRQAHRDLADWLKELEE